MKSVRITLVLFTLILLFSQISFASHLSGASITYKALGNNRYYIEVMALRDCNGATYSSWNETVDALCTSNSTARWNTHTVTHVPFVAPNPAPFGGPYAGVTVISGSNSLTAQEIALTCNKVLNPAVQPVSRCRRGISNGYMKFKFSAIITLTPCNWWRLGFAPVCCRNTGASNTSSSGIYVHTFLNTLDYPNNTAPFFEDEDFPARNTILGVTNTFSLGAHDLDGDSLRFELTCAMDDSTRCVTYRTGYSSSAPVNGASLDSVTGIFSCTPLTTGKRVIAYWVKEYDKCTKTLKSKTLRDMQILINADSNKLPYVKNALHNLTGSAIINSRGAIEVKEGDVISWDQTFADSNVTDSLYIITNIGQALPGATYKVISTGKRNEIIVRTTWRALLGNSAYRVATTSFNDDYCNYPGWSANAVEIKVIRSVGISSNNGSISQQSACIGDTINLNVEGARRYSWRSISGNTLQTGVNWFPDTTSTDTNKNAKFVVTQTTVLEVTGVTFPTVCSRQLNLNQTKDTITIFATDSFNITGKLDTLVCAPAFDTLNIETTNSRYNYTYLWENKKLLRSDSTKNPILRGLKKPSSFQVTVESNGGCKREAEVKVDISDPIPVSNFINANDSLLCLGDTLALELNLGSINLDSCTSTHVRCLGNEVIRNSIGNSFSTDTVFESYPLVYGSKVKSGKIQFLFRANELSLMGVKKGLLTSIAFEVTNLPNVVGRFTSYEIKVACTNLTEAAQFTHGPKFTVFSTDNYTPKLGWNTHTFDQNYSWAGQTNLLFEICYKTDAAVAFHPAIKLNSTPYFSSRMYAQKTDSLACSSLQQGNGFFNRPAIRLGYCDGVKKDNYSFNWRPVPSSGSSGFITKTDSASINVVPNVNTARTFEVEISDTNGVCSERVRKTITLISKYNTKIDSVSPICNSKKPIQLKAATPANITSPGGKWTGAGIVDSRNGLWDRYKSGPGKHWVYYEITGNSCASKDSLEIEVLNLPNAAIQPIDFACAKYGDVPEHELKGIVAGGAFLGFGVSSKTVSGKRVYFLDGTRFTPTLSNPDTVEVRHVVGSTQCKNDTIIKIPVLPHWDTTYLGVYNQGVPYFTTDFCPTAGTDTLAVRGVNGVWRISNPNSSAAILDSIHGVFDPKKVNNGKGGSVTVEVENSGFCGAKGSVELNVVGSPEVKILAEDFCFKVPGNCVGSGVPANLENDTLLVRVAKFPHYRINEADPNTYVDVVNANASNTGWSGILSGPFTKWDGYFWMNHTDRCAHRFCHLPPGRYPISYRLGMSYRPWKSDSVCYSVDDTAVFMNNNFRLNVAKTGSLCNDGTVELDAATNRAGTAFSWKDGTVGSKAFVTKPGVYTVYASYKYCDTKDSITVVSCVGTDEALGNTQVKLFPNPSRTSINLVANTKANSVQLQIHTLSGQLVETFNFENNSDKVEANIDVSRLTPGVYLFKLNAEGEVSAYRVVVE